MYHIADRRDGESHGGHQPLHGQAHRRHPQGHRHPPEQGKVSRTADHLDK